MIIADLSNITRPEQITNKKNAFEMKIYMFLIYNLHKFEMNLRIYESQGIVMIIFL